MGNMGGVQMGGCIESKGLVGVQQAAVGLNLNM